MPDEIADNGGGESGGSTAVADAPAIGWGGSPGGGDQSTEQTAQPAADDAAEAPAGEQTDTAAEPTEDEDPVLAALRTPAEQAEDQIHQPQAAKPDANKTETPATTSAPALSDAVKTKLADALGDDAASAIVGEINSQFAALHKQIAAVEPISKRVEGVAERQAKEDEQRYVKMVNDVFDSMHDEGMDIYGKGATANADARMAVHQKADQIAAELLAKPAALTALKQKLGVKDNADPKLRLQIYKTAHTRIYGKQPTKKEAIESVRKDVQTRHTQRTVQPGGRSASGNGTGEVTHNSLTRIWKT